MYHDVCSQFMIVPNYKTSRNAVSTGYPVHGMYADSPLLKYLLLEKHTDV